MSPAAAGDLSSKPSAAAAGDMTSQISAAVAGDMTRQMSLSDPHNASTQHVIGVAASVEDSLHVEDRVSTSADVSMVEEGLDRSAYEEKGGFIDVI